MDFNNIDWSQFWDTVMVPWFSFLFDFVLSYVSF